MSVSLVEGVVTLDGRTEGRNLVNTEGFGQFQWMIYVRGLWHRITIFDGWRYKKDLLLTSILTLVAPDEMIPVMYHKDGNDAVFFVTDSGAAIKKLCKTNLKLFNPTGPKFVLKIELRYPMATKICIRSIMEKTITSKMYNASEKCLRLSRFHEDPEFENLLYCPLTLRRISDEVISVVCPHLSTLRILILSHNSLALLQGFSHLSLNAPNLRILDLQFNLLPDVSTLGPLRGLQLNELILDGNPLCELYEDDLKYVNDVREIFPNLFKLDGVFLPPHGLPVSHKNYICSPQGIRLAEQFVAHYYKLYDGWNGNKTRLDLGATYHKDALFSLSAAPVTMGNSVPHPPARFNQYFSSSRNLLKTSDYTKHNKFLHQGSDKIVKRLAELPLTELDKGSISVDMPHYNEKFAVLVVRGVFRELDVSENYMYSFNRIFALSQNNDNYFIVNDIFFITNVTNEQAEFSFKSFPPMPSKPSNEELMRINDPNYDIKEHMVEELTKATEMNFRWSRKCLTETEWDLQEALIIFMELYKEGAIPAEAFKT